MVTTSTIVAQERPALIPVARSVLRLRRREPSGATLQGRGWPVHAFGGGSAPFLGAGSPRSHQHEDAIVLLTFTTAPFIASRAAPSPPDAAVAALALIAFTAAIT